MPSLTLEQAQDIIAKALEHGRETACAPLTVAVLDPGGHLQALAREDGAGIIRPELATAKAWGSLGWGAGSRALVGKSPEFIAGLAAISQGRVFPSPGGVLVRDAQGNLLGAVGVTGDKGDRDEACAIAAIEALGFVADCG